MEIRIFDVEHGFCALVIADNNNLMLFDCGYNQTTGFRPSNYLFSKRCTGIEQLIISNFDEDHLDDLPRLANYFSIEILSRNPSINRNELYDLKLRTGGSIAPGMQALLGMMTNYNVSPTFLSLPNFAGIQLVHFWNRFPDFEDTNNLSLVSFLRYGDIHIVFPGDIEKKGWRQLLSIQEFRKHLSLVNIFIASHHGRESGYCEELFNYCKPKIVIISDESIKYATQGTREKYRRHTSGFYVNGVNRHWLTTRSDGMITISQYPGSNLKISTSK
jgi:beta-lactamase superfamily II metal-dependent hydrolase